MLLSHLKTYDTKTSDGRRMQTSKVESPQSSNLSRADLREFIKGELLKGQVVDLRNNLATILLSDGSMVQGKLEQEVALYIGQSAIFEVAKTGENGIQLKMVSQETTNPMDQLAQKALMQAGLPVNEKNCQVVSELLKANQSVDKQSLQQFLRMAHQLPEANVRDLVFLQKNHLPVTPENLSMLTEYQNSEHRVVSQITTLTTGLGQLCSEGLEDRSIGELMKMALKQTEYSNGGDVQEPLQDSFSSEQLLKMANALKQTNFPEDLVRQVREGKMTGTELLSEILQETKQSGESTTKMGKLQQLIRNEELVKVLKEELLHNYTISPKHLAKKENVEKFYDKLEKDLEQMAEILKHTSSGEDASKLSDQTQHLKNNLNFMKTLNQIYPYIQLPVKLKNQNLHSELYVYTKRKGHAEYGEQMSILLHLDMQHLGALDIHLQMKDKSLKAKFYVEDNEVQRLFEGTIHELEEAMEIQGYNIHSEFYQQEKELNSIERLMEQEEASPGIAMKRYTFDIRA